MGRDDGRAFTAGLSHLNDRFELRSYNLSQKKHSAILVSCENVKKNSKYKKKTGLKVVISFYRYLSL